MAWRVTEVKLNECDLCVGSVDLLKIEPLEVSPQRVEFVMMGLCEVDEGR